MEAEKIKNALNNCIGSNPCKNCPYETGYLNFPACAVSLMKDALKLIFELESKLCKNTNTPDLPGKRGERNQL